MQLCEVRVHERTLRCNATAWLVFQHLVQQVKSLVVDNCFADEVPKIEPGVVGPVNLGEVFVLTDAGPCLVRRLA